MKPVTLSSERAVLPFRLTGHVNLKHIGLLKFLGHTLTVQLIQRYGLQTFTPASSVDRGSKNIFIFSRTTANINKT